jgi:hypothetical protein
MDRAVRAFWRIKGRAPARLYQTSQMSTPRFTDEHLIPLRRVMLTRQPDFAYTTADVDALVQETGLLRSQIQKWAGHFRERMASRKLDDVMANLRGHKAVSDGLCFE